MTTLPALRIGHGYDIHRFTHGDHITLGGVRIAHTQAVLAHSDGDVLLHALMDAMLGALALGDIGKHFPDTEPRYRGANSRELLRHVHALVSAEGWALVNADISVLAQAPKLAPHILVMRERVAADLLVDISRISIKATTNEGLDAVGRSEGIAVHAVVLLSAL